MENLKSVLTDGAVVYRNELGQYHRDGGPAIEYANGTKHYFINGKRHREGGPAVVYIDGNEEWWVDGNRVRWKMIEIDVVLFSLWLVFFVLCCVFLFMYER